MIKARILSAHDKGTHAEVVVKVKKVLKSGKVKIARSNRSIYPESWTNRGCTCPILNPGKDKMLTRYFPYYVNSGDNSLWTLAMATQHFPPVFLGQSPLIHPHPWGSHYTAAVKRHFLIREQSFTKKPKPPGNVLLSVTLLDLPEYLWLEECVWEKKTTNLYFYLQRVFSHIMLYFFLEKLDIIMKILESGWNLTSSMPL